MDSQSSQQDSSHKPQVDPALKWGVTAPEGPIYTTKPEDSYTAEEQAERQKLRDKGVNPDLKAEMDRRVHGKDDESGKKKHGFWSKVAQTSIGGGTIK